MVKRFENVQPKRFKATLVWTGGEHPRKLCFVFAHRHSVNDRSAVEVGENKDRTLMEIGFIVLSKVVLQTES